MPHNGYRAFDNKLLKKIIPNITNLMDWLDLKEKYKKR